MKQVKLSVIEYIHDNGMENVSVEDCVKATAIKAREMVPDPIVKDLQQQVQQFIEQRAEQWRTKSVYFEPSQFDRIWLSFQCFGLA